LYALKKLLNDAGKLLNDDDYLLNHIRYLLNNARYSINLYHNLVRNVYFPENYYNHLMLYQHHVTNDENNFAVY